MAPCKGAAVVAGEATTRARQREGRKERWTTTIVVVAADRGRIWRARCRHCPRADLASSTAPPSSSAGERRG
ncbi:Os01g0138166 [Oryza sativa Japonica Group]|uniref:Os01g0138166 protein n=1 Tax=Oryza sativa subsp. japonica TaxID=39947 RepID=A0A0P0UY95_ORYSJ|nr:Os01g0138166 [Oryza sativa Japonica Group]